ncbi:hypothetical protein [Dokdonia sp. Asnod2-E02]|uniref:hypothetical protein n=1 Tax=Dokdonia sp. Asnod2-E02 TaxID=3160574 RepID=UPI0038670252
MNLLLKLEKTINIFFVALQILFVLGIAGVIIGIIRGDILNINNLEPTSAYNLRSWKFLVILFSYFAIYYLFIRVVSHLKQTIPFLKKGFSFSEPVASKLKQAGKLLIFIGYSLAILSIITPLFLTSKFKIDVIETILSPFFFVILGLFLKYFGQAFLQARDLQNENNLTI